MNRNATNAANWRNKQREKGNVQAQIMLKPETMQILKKYKEQDSSATYSSIIEKALFEMDNKNKVLIRKLKI